MLMDCSYQEMVFAVTFLRYRRSRIKHSQTGGPLSLQSRYKVERKSEPLLICVKYPIALLPKQMQLPDLRYALTNSFDCIVLEWLLAG